MAEQVKSNIDNTIGVPWEAIIIDNSTSPRGITEVYNEGAKKARFDTVCFVHEDVGFLTQDWGKLVNGYFTNDPSLGIIGVAGSLYKSKTPSGWMTLIDDFDRCNIYHLDSGGNKERLYFDQPPANPLKEVVILDGVFLCSRKSIILKIPFDQGLLKGFHLYDLDISYRISRFYKVAVSFEIDLVHYTEGGDFGDKWIEDTLRWHDRYKEHFPVFCENKNEVAVRSVEYRVRRFYLKRLKIEKISFKNKVQWIKRSGALSNIHLWPDILIFFLYRQVKNILRRRKRRVLREQFRQSK